MKRQSVFLTSFAALIVTLIVLATIGLPAEERLEPVRIPYLDRAPAIASGTLPGESTLPETELRGSSGPIVVLPEHFDVSVPMRDIDAPPRRAAFRPEPQVSLPSAQHVGTEASLADFAEISQNWPGAVDALGAPQVNVDTLPNITGYYPPDVEGDVGPNHYVEYINVDWAVYDKNGVIVPGWPKAGNSFWSGFGGVCETENDGDPIVIYDHLADRWLVSQFAVPDPYYQCVAISTSPDPTGSWYRYAYQWPNGKFNDYPHFGLWPDGYYLTMNQFSGNSWGGAGVAVMERTEMLAGNPGARMVYFDLYGVDPNYGGQLPADLEGDPPPAGTPNYILEWDEAGVFGSSDAVGIWEFHVDWVTPANSTLGLSGDPNYIINTANVDTDLCTATREQCIDQPGTTVNLEAIADRLMWRVQYRNFGGYQVMVANHTVDSNNPAGRAGIHWFELRDSGSGWGMHQQGLYAPADGLNRWMGSIAMDPAGNIAMGYSVSSGAVYPSIRYVGRHASDPLGTMPQAERTIVTGSGYQSGSAARWGDYSSISLDTGINECIFWYVQEYIKTTGATSWQTRLASFEFDGCGTPDFAIDATPATLDICAPDNAVYSVATTAYYGYNQTVSLSSSGRPAGTTGSFSPSSGAPPFNSTFTIGNTGAAAAGTYNVDVTGDGPGKQHVDTVVLNLYTAAPAAPALSSPADGATDVSVTPDLSWSTPTQAKTYDVEIATDPAFSNIVASATDLDSASFTPSALDSDTVYYWRVRARNACSAGDYSDVRAFRTQAQTCTTYGPGTIGTIRDATVFGPRTSSFTLNVPDATSILDVDVIDLRGTHTWVSDLDFNLVSPENTTVQLWSRLCGDTDNFDKDLDDEAASALTCPLNDNATQQPTGSLSDYDTEQSNGTWTLRITDNVRSDSGTLQAWYLRICSGGAGTVADYSDLDTGYGVASHSGGGTVRLGASWTADSGFTPVGNDNASDDGVTLDPATGWQEGATVRVYVDVTAASGTYYVAGWFDWNDDGDFLDASEKIIGQNVTGGASPGYRNTIQFTIPNGVGYTAGRQVNGRFRLYASEPARTPQGTETAYGDATSGEVEDTRFQPTGPTAVTLTDFRASARGSDVRVLWATGSELGLAGFNLYRSTRAAGPYVQLNSTLIAAQNPGSPQGASYQWLDRGLRLGRVYYYRLEQVDVNGTMTQHGPLAVRVGTRIRPAPVSP